MLNKNTSNFKEYLVYIIYDRKKNSHINISNEERLVFDDQAEKYSKLVYFEKFNDKSKAIKKKRYLSKLNEAERIKLVMKKNPEMLNLILTIYDK